MNRTFKVSDVYKIQFFENVIEVEVTKISKKGITLEHKTSGIKLENYSEEELNKMIID